MHPRICTGWRLASPVGSPLVTTMAGNISQLTLGSSSYPIGSRTMVVSLLSSFNCNIFKEIWITILDKPWTSLMTSLTVAMVDYHIFTTDYAYISYKAISDSPWIITPSMNDSTIPIFSHDLSQVACLRPRWHPLGRGARWNGALRLVPPDVQSQVSTMVAPDVIWWLGNPWDFL